MSEDAALRITAHLASPLGGDAPQLDGLLLYIASRKHGKHVDPGSKVHRSGPCPNVDHIPLGLLHVNVGGYRIARCTSPILEEPIHDEHSHFAKRIGVEHAAMLDPDERKVVTTTNGWTKSYRLPLRTRTLNRVVWLAAGRRRSIKDYLDDIDSIGGKFGHGFGRVEKWEIERIGDAPHPMWPLWIESDAGPVLMRPVPACRELPPGLIGARRGYGACSPPYWHRDRFAEVMEPC